MAGRAHRGACRRWKRAMHGGAGHPARKASGASAVTESRQRGEPRGAMQRTTGEKHGRREHKLRFTDRGING